MAAAALAPVDRTPRPLASQYGTYTDSVGRTLPRWTSDGILVPGEGVEVDFPLSDDGSPAPFGGGTGTLSSTGPLGIGDPAPLFSASASGATVNAAPVVITAPAGPAVCGTRYPLALGMGGAKFAYRVPTGAAGAYRRTSSQRGLFVAGGSETSTVEVEYEGLAKDVRVHLDALDHNAPANALRIALRAPDLSEIVLFDGSRLASNQPPAAFSDVTFSETAVDGRMPVSAAAAAATGLSNVVVKPQDSFAALDGAAVEGTWSLVITDASAPAEERSHQRNRSSETARGRVGTGRSGAAQNGWHLDTATAVCDGAPVAWLPDPIFVSPEGDILDGSGSNDPTPGGSIAGWEWDLDNDGVYELTTPERVAFPAMAPGTSQLVKLRVTDNAGNVSPVIQRMVVVTTAPTVTSITASPVAPRPKQTVTLTAAATDAETPTTGLHYAWDLDGTGTFVEGADDKTTASWDTLGPKRVRVRVTDGDGASTEFETTITVTTAAPKAVLKVTPMPAIVGATVTLDGRASSDADGAVKTYEWDVDGDGTFDLSGPGSTVSHSFPAAGVPEVTLRVVDEDGATGQATVPVVVTQAPRAVLSPSTTVPLTGDSVSVSAAGSFDPDGTIVSYEWDLDGNTSWEASGPQLTLVSRSYPNPGSVSVRLRVTDDRGAKTTADVTLTVRAHPVPAPSGSSTPGGNAPVVVPAVVIGPSGQPLLPTKGTDADALASNGFGGATPPARAVALDGFVVAINAGRAVKGKQASTKGIAVALSANEPGTALVRAMITPAQAKKAGIKAAGRKPFWIGSGTLTLRKAGRAKLTVKIASKYRTSVRRATNLKLTLRGVVTSRAGTKVAVARVVTVKR